MNRAEEIAARFRVTRPNGKVDGADVWAIPCQAHAGKSDDSLHLWVTDRGYLSVKCHAGCSTEAVLSALGESQGGPPPPLRPKAKAEPKPPPVPRPLPTGKAFWPPHIYTDQAGKPVLAVVRKDLGLDEGVMRKTFIQFTPADGDLWIPVGLERNRPLFHLPKLSQSGRVRVVEGEKCVSACEAAWPDQLVTTFAGGAAAWQRTDYEPLRGRDISLLADTDDKSRTAMSQLAYYLDSELDCAVHIALPEGETGEDVADWIEEGPEAAAKRIESLLQPYESDDSDTVEPPREPRPPVEGDIRDNAYYQVLGLEGSDVAIWWKAGGQKLTLGAASLCQPNTLVAFAPQVFWCGLFGVDAFATATARRAGDSLIRVAEDLGQVDTNRLTGRGAFALPDGRVVWHLGDRLLLPDGQQITLRGGGGALFDRWWQSEAPIELGVSASDQEMREAAEAVMAYRWDTPTDGHRFLGWIVSALVGGALSWRPHLLLTAPSTVGKSWITQQVLARVMGPLMLTVADATPAALARHTDVSSLPIAIDEAEPSSPWVTDLFSLIRISSGGDGMRLRADGASGGVVAQQPRFSAFLASTAIPHMQTADRSRMTIVRLGKEVDHWPSVQAGILSTMKLADKIRWRIIRRTPEIVAAVVRRIAVFEEYGMSSREARASAVLTVGWHEWALDQSSDHDVYAQEADREDIPDGVQLLNEILALQIHLEAGRAPTLLEALRSKSSADLDESVVDRFGVKRNLVDRGKREDGALAIFAEHDGLSTALSRAGSRFANVNRRELLEQIEGAGPSENALRFGGRRKQGVLIPSEVLMRFGIFITDPPDAETGTAPPEPRQDGF